MRSKPVRRDSTGRLIAFGGPPHRRQFVEQLTDPSELLPHLAIGPRAKLSNLPVRAARAMPAAVFGPVANGGLMPGHRLSQLRPPLVVRPTSPLHCIVAAALDSAQFRAERATTMAPSFRIRALFYRPRKLANVDSVRAIASTAWLLAKSVPARLTSTHPIAPYCRSKKRRGDVGGHFEPCQGSFGAGSGAPQKTPN